MIYSEKHIGRRVACTISGTKIEDARIFVKGTTLYICQEVMNGNKPNLSSQMQGYTRAWATPADFQEGNNGITELVLLEEEDKPFDDSYEIF